jgi:hypothetical protein
MWVIAEYQPTTLFSLRPANATTSGGKSLLTPTPFAVKMALLDAAIRVYGRGNAEAWFPRIRDLQIAIALPEHISVINTFVKIMRPHKGGAKDVFGTGLVGPMGNTIAYREMVQFAGSLRLALNDNNDKGAAPPIATLLTQINYLGKRGGFMQLTQLMEENELEPEFTLLTNDGNGEFLLGSMMQLLDDCGPKMTFEHADIYSGKGIGINNPNGRLLRHIILPYRVARSSRGYTLYRRVG